MATPWCVKVTCLPQGVTNDDLAEKFGIPPDNIDVPQNQQGPNYYGWVNGFADEQLANNFIRRWNNERIRSGTIKCKVLPTKSHVILGRPPSVPTKNDNRSDLGVSHRQLGKNSPAQSLGHKRILGTMMPNRNNNNDDDSDDENDKPSRSAFVRAGRSENADAYHYKTRAPSTTGEVSKLSPIGDLNGTNRRSNPRSQDNSCSSRMSACRNGLDCFNGDCLFRHPSGWYACKDGIDCQDFNCHGNHPYGRTKPCDQGDQCKNITCKFLHSSTRIGECDIGDECREWSCKALHSQNRPKPCFYEQHCYNTGCLRLHPPDRQLCLSGTECVNLSCPLNHPPGRPSRCEQGSACGNFFCMDLHPDEWDPCEAGSECTNPKCPHTSHPPDRILLSQQNGGNTLCQSQYRRELKSKEQRYLDREKQKLPILASKDEFCRRLKEDRMLVVIAETGSGKSTQLPQYAAEYFGGLIVCTQPRVIATTSLARRVANEYDGTSVGESVGYQVGYGGVGRDNNRVPGRDILFMTDAALIQESQRDQQLSKIKVLIIDEAHERSLNTDIVIGLAKLLLDARPHDFYVVIASATIDPTQFLTFFKRTQTQILNVPGQMFGVSVEYMSKPEDSTEDDIYFTVSTALKLYNNHHEGHILVFLPGQGEIEQALEHFSREIPDNCVALPLYGSLSTEEQDRVLQFDEGPNRERRMVVFCTNVAETSLTIKNIRLVIDSGWAKEARFDPKRRLTVIEMVRISKSSANQRKGRAGRTAPGHCVRLYNETELTRHSIEPEISRSSLDLVVLQLLRLQLTPSNFPFMDPPAVDVLQKSLYLLRDLECVDEKEAITLRGELFAELGLDPRLSAFMVDTYIEHSPILDLTATIGAILTAPGSLFFMGGATKEEKQAARGRVAVGAQKHNSDLLYLVSIYKTWQNVGVVDPTTRTCLTCQTSIKRVNSCRSCRVAHSMKHTLNNKILNNIEVTSNNMIKTIKNKRWQLNPRLLSEVDETDIIGAQLFKNFPEQHGHLLVPHLPNEGVCMVANDLRARISSVSVFVQRRVGSNHFIAMSITKLSTGDYVIERLHPLMVRESIRSKTITELYSVLNVGWERNFEIRKQTNDWRNESWSAWLVYEYNRCKCKLTVWGEAETKESLHRALTPVLNKTLDSLLARTRPLDCGPIRASFESGLTCSHIENLHHSNSAKSRIDLQHVPCKSFDELDGWLNSTLGIYLRDIRENNFQPLREPILNDEDYEAPPFFIVFKSEETFKNSVAKIPSFHVCPQRLDSTDVLHMNEKDAWGRQLLLKTENDQFCTEKEIKDEMGQFIVSCKQVGKKFLPGLQLSNMPANVNETYVRNTLGNDPTVARIDIFNSDRDNPQIGSTSARVFFQNTEQCHAAQHRLRSHFFQSHFITIYSKKSGKYIRIPVRSSVEKLKIEPQTFLCTARSRRIATEIYSKCPLCIIDGSSSVTVTHLELYPKFEQILQYICDRFRVKIQQNPLPARKERSDAVRCVVTEANPPKTAMAASVLSQATSPIIIKLTDDRQKCLFKELFDENLIQTWTKELKLSCEKKDKYGSVIEIYGPQIEQGQLMRRIGDYSDTFDDRYRVLDLSAETIGYFGPHKAADIKLQEINSKWLAEGCSVTFIRRTSTVLLYAQPKVSPEMINACENEVKQLLDTLVTISNDNESIAEQQEFARQCAFCQRTMAATRTFRICGHAYCRCALSMLNQLPLQCPTCHFRIHIQDIQEIFSNNRADVTKLCKTSIQTYLLSSANPKDNDQLFCPNDGCDGLIIRSQGYQTCLTCGQSVCGMCCLIDDELHEGRTCTERNEAQRKLGEFLPRLFQEAEIFTKNNWPLELPPIIRFDHNTCLNQTACTSLERFYNGVKSVGEEPPPDFARGFFAFHGTSVNAVEPICKSGFDPTRRKGQVHGPGEYFGITAAVSHGYSKPDNSSPDTRMMIIAFILRCNRVTTQKGFCYVVNNPVDWSAAFNLPVAVVTYGNDVHKNHPSPFSIYTASSVSINSNDTSIVWNSPFRWHWRQDDGKFEPYNDKINSELEQLYDRWKLGNGSSKVITSPLVRYVDDIPQTYYIDFQGNSQTNTKTNFVRRIERRALASSKISGSNNWRFRNEHHQWKPYESLIQQTIENAYQLYRSQQGPSTLVVQFPGRPESYQIDFVAGRQMNMTTSEIRLITRE